FFFQAEDGIRDRNVTGVQTCALPISLVPGLALLVVAGILLAGALGGDSILPGIYAQVGVFLILGVAAVVCAGALVLGRTWARSPVVVIALMTLGIGWYATGPSSRPGFGVPVLIAAVVILVLLFRRPSRAWVLGQLPGESEESAARRGGAQGRRAEREGWGGHD